MRLTAAQALFIGTITVFTQWESPACIGQGAGLPVEVCGWCWLWGTSSHQTAIKAVCLPPRLSINICSVLSEPVWDCQWEIQLWRCDSWEHRLPGTSFTAQPTFSFFFHFQTFTLGWLSERGARLTQMLHELQFSPTCVCLARAKKCTRTATEKQGVSLMGLDLQTVWVHPSLSCFACLSYFVLCKFLDMHSSLPISFCFIKMWGDSWGPGSFPLIHREHEFIMKNRVM